MRPRAIDDSEIVARTVGFRTILKSLSLSLSNRSSPQRANQKANEEQTDNAIPEPRQIRDCDHVPRFFGFFLRIL